ncbi:hypothetical protein K439DRAFT_1637827, partial [Ramaria rubella]
MTYFTVWYIDSRCTLVTTPVILAGSQELQNGDLYLHFNGEGGSPMCMWVHTSSKDGLTLDQCPTWLKKETMGKYKHCP